MVDFISKAKGIKIKIHLCLLPLLMLIPVWDLFTDWWAVYSMFFRFTIGSANIDKCVKNMPGIFDSNGVMHDSWYNKERSTRDK